MAYFPTESRIGVLGFANVDTASALPFGTQIRGQDSASGKGGGVFIYGSGGTSVAAGSVVTYNPTGSTALTNAGSESQGKPVAVSMAALNTASKYGWFQVQGVAQVLKAAVKINPGVKLYLSATSGRVTSAAASGKQLLNMLSANTATVASATSTVNVLLGYGPFQQGAEV